MEFFFLPIYYLGQIYFGVLFGDGFWIGDGDWSTLLRKYLGTGWNGHF